MEAGVETGFSFLSLASLGGDSKPDGGGSGGEGGGGGEGGRNPGALVLPSPVARGESGGPLSSSVGGIQRERSFLTPQGSGGGGQRATRSDSADVMSPLSLVSENESLGLSERVMLQGLR